MPDEHEHETPASEDDEAAPAGDPGSSGEETEDDPSIEWFAHAARATCPACGAPGALVLGEGTFCPTCGEVTTPRQQSG